MKGLLFAVMVAALGFGGYFYWKQRTAQTTQLAVVDKGPPAKPTRDRKKRRRRGALRVARNDTFVGAEPSMPAGGGAPSGGEAPVAGGASTTEVGPDDVLGGLSSPQPGRRVADEAPEPAPIKLSASDLRTVARGDDLTEPTVTRLDLSDGTRELSQDEIDTRFRSKEDAILGCISRARPDEYTWIPGRVSVGFRIEKSGGVRGVRVEGPAILQKNGLYGCVKGVVGGLKFPASSGSQVVTYPFSLT